MDIVITSYRQSTDICIITTRWRDFSGDFGFFFILLFSIFFSFFFEVFLAVHLTKGHQPVFIRK